MSLSASILRSHAPCAVAGLAAQHAAAYKISNASVPTVMELKSKFPELSQQDKYSRILEGLPGARQLLPGHTQHAMCACNCMLRARC